MPKPEIKGVNRHHAEIDAERRSVATSLEHQWGADPLRWNRTGSPHSWLQRMAGTGKYACSDPVTILSTGRPLTKAGKSHVYGVGALPMILTEKEVRCRQCENCRKARAALWRIRAIGQIKHSDELGCRTWFGTLTLSAEQHSRVLMACQLHASRNGDDFDKFSPERQFRARHECISREITLYLKRLRSKSEASFTFLLVAEEHKNGLPHYHMLIHEKDPAKPLRHV